MGTSFSLQVRKMVKKTQQRGLAIHKEAIRITDREMSKPRQAGGNMPYLTGNLQRSRIVTTKGPPEADVGDKKYADPTGYIDGVINGLQLNQKVWLGFRAPYAAYQENRHGFVRLALQAWPDYVKQAVERTSGKTNYND